MPQEVDITYKGFKASLKLRHRALSFIKVLLLWLGAAHVIRAHGWLLLLPYVAIFLVFCHYLGVPNFVNVLRCRKAYQGRLFQLKFTLVNQCIFVAVLPLILNAIGIQEMFVFYLVTGLISAFSMPKEQLLQERMNINKALLANPWKR
jgi:hypothetical protein